MNLPTRANISHHLITAWAITAALYLATVFGWTYFIDGLLLRFVHNFSPRYLQHQKGKVDPAIIQITTTDYASLFGNTSPLDRSELLRGLQAVITKKPAAIAIDIDVSPNQTRPDQAQEDLDKILDQALNAGVQIFLITPLGIAPTAGDQEWMINRCEHGVIFGFPYIEREYGVTLRYRTDYPSLGAVVHSWYERGGPARGRALRNRKNAQISQENTPAGRVALLERTEICRMLSSGLALEAIEGLLWHVALWRESVPIDMSTSFVCVQFGDLTRSCQPSQSEEKLRHRTSPSQSHAAINLDNLAEKIVFVGGGYDPRDSALTGVGRVDGVFVHAAIAASDKTNWAHLPAYFLELGVGLGLGLVLSFTWGQYHASVKAYKEHIAQDHATFAPVMWWIKAIGKLCCNVLWWAGAVVFCAIMFGIVVGLSIQMFADGTWLNPAPIAVGMLLETFIASHHGVDTDEGHKKELPVWKHLLLHPGLLWKLPLIAYSIWDLLSNFLFLQGH